MLCNLNRRRFLRTAAGVLVPAGFAIGQSLRNPAFVARLTSASAPVTGFFNENFEDVSAGYDTNNVNGWTSTGTIDPKSTTTPLAGSQSVLLTGETTPSQITSADFSAKSTVWGRFIYSASATPSAETAIVALLDSSATARCGFKISNGRQFRGFHGSATVNTFTGNSNTPYWIWFRYVAGSGSNGVLDIYNSTNSTRPADPTYKITAGTSTQSVVRLKMWAALASTSMKYDSILLSDDEIA
jgi:hypothetical protein